jgi:hypothetical protein
MVVTINVIAFWYMMLYNLVASYQHFGRNFRAEKYNAVFIYTWVAFLECRHKQRFTQIKANYPASVYIILF